MSHLLLILGAQLHPEPHPLLVDFDPADDELLMVELCASSIWKADRSNPLSMTT